MNNISCTKKSTLSWGRGRGGCVYVLTPSDVPTLDPPDRRGRLSGVPPPGPRVPPETTHGEEGATGCHRRPRVGSEGRDRCSRNSLVSFEKPYVYRNLGGQSRPRDKSTIMPLSNPLRTSPLTVDILWVGFGPRDPCPDLGDPRKGHIEGSWVVIQGRGTGLSGPCRGPPDPSKMLSPR